MALRMGAGLPLLTGIYPVEPEDIMLKWDSRVR